MADMAARLMAYRIAFVRQALREASSGAECLPALAAMVELASDLREDDLAGTGAARARQLLDEAMKYLRAASATLPVGGEEYSVALYLLARAGLLRDGAGLVPDADDAIACLRRLRVVLPAEEPDRSEVELLLADALLTRGAKADGRAADVDDAAQVLASVLAALPPDDRRRHHVTAGLSLVLGLRYAGFAGTDEDRDAAEAQATSTLADPGAPDESAATAHLVLAWTALTRQHTARQRSTMLQRAAVEAARSDAGAAARLLAAFGEVRTSVADAETAIGHLRQIPPGSGSGNAFTRTSVPRLWSFAQLALMQAGAEVADVGQVAESLGSLAADPKTAETDRGELLALRAALLAGQSEAQATSALGDAVSGLPPGHLMRSPLLSTLTSVLSRQVDQAGSAADLSAGLDDVVATLDRLPHDTPRPRTP
jgi:hypothetical protein